MGARKALILGNPGTGKSSAMRTLDPSSTFVINCDEKDLPIRGWRGLYKSVYSENKKLDISSSNLFNTTKPSQILSLLQIISSSRPDIKVIVIDTISMMLVSEYMEKAKDKSFDKFTQFALDLFNIIKALDGLRDDLTIFVLAHTETASDSEGIRQTQFMVPGGKLVSEKIKIEGMFTVVLYTDVVMEQGEPRYYFITQNNGKNTCKSPEGMFEDLRIPNDLQYVTEKIEEYEK